MNVFIDYNTDEGFWEYYFYDSENYKTIVQGFSNHIKAEIHIKQNQPESSKIHFK